jgi:hypothetical protein
MSYKPCVCASYCMYIQTVHEQLSMSCTKQTNSGSVQPYIYSHFSLLHMCLLSVTCN